jgi:hypothetical protein
MSTPTQTEHLDDDQNTGATVGVEDLKSEQDQQKDSSEDKEHVHTTECMPPLCGN